MPKAAIGQALPAKMMTTHRPRSRFVRRSRLWKGKEQVYCWNEAERDAVMATVQHAMTRGIETVFQLEEGEVLAEPTPSRKDRKALFFYEAVEGGAGALSRLIQEPSALSAAATSRKA